MMAKPFSVCDAETDPFKRGRIPAPFIWGWYDGTIYKSFDSTEKFLEFIYEYDGICYAHNGGKFDFHWLLDGLEPWDDIMIINGRIAKMQIGLCELRDSYNIIPVPLSAYKKDDIDYAIFETGEREKPKNKLKIAKYLRSDCVYLHQLIERYYAEYGANLTQAGGSMKQWVKISKQAAPKTNGEFYDRFAPFYYGGRVECFRAGIINCNFSVYDINSAYPFAMLSKHPYSENFHVSTRVLKNFDFVRVLCVANGCFPYRGLGGIGGFDFGLTFPNDDVQREYTVTKWEFDAALDTNAISKIKILECYSFATHTDFAPYVNHFYEKRLQAAKCGDDAGKLLYKLAMNSLYGKFAANPANYKNYCIAPMESIANLNAYGWNFGGELGPWALAEKPLDEMQMRYYNVATGASITGYVRAMLWRAMKASTGVLYCDTDSIAVEHADLKLGDKLGEWKHEGNFDKAGIAGKKLYIFRGCAGTDTKYASKGVRLSESELWQVARGEAVTYEPENPTFSVKARNDEAGVKSNQFFVNRRVVKTAREKT